MVGVIYVLLAWPWGVGGAGWWVTSIAVHDDARDRRVARRARLARLAQCRAFLMAGMYDVSCCWCLIPLRGVAADLAVVHHDVNGGRAPTWGYSC